ncbi:MAG: hypothetical protein R3E56_21485 [Burkholderiaceae bacterium]
MKPRKTRRRYDASSSSRSSLSARAGASVASIALSHGINANVVHSGAASVALPALHPRSFCLAAASRVPLRRISASSCTEHHQRHVTWPLAAEQCAVWMRELLN